jgi:hypothetical protein
MSVYLSQGPVLDAQRSFVTGARPDAPVVPYVEPRPRTAAARRRAAGALYRLADRIAPAPAPAIEELAC